MRQCNTCALFLPDAAFHKCKASSDGLQYKCKQCKALFAATQYALNSAREAENRRARRQKDIEACRARERVKNRRHSEYRKNWYLQNRERALELRSERFQRDKTSEAFISKQREADKRRVDSLDDNYLKRLLAAKLKVKITDVPRALIEPFRLVIQIQRAAKGKQT